MSARYPIVLFDLDHTLFDFEGSKDIAFRAVLGANGIDATERHFEMFEQVERPLWRGLENGELTLDTLNERRFEGLVAKAELDIDPAHLSDIYLDWLGKSGGLLPGARELLDSLAGRCTMAMVSNGYGQVQRARMDKFDMGRYFDVQVVSNEIGVAKPDPRFFDQAFALLGNPEPKNAIMIGDSLTSDIAGANNYDLACCWYNPFGKENTTELRIDHSVSELSEITEIVLGPVRG